MNVDVHVSHWVISDGNYDEFRQGDIRDFALEYYAPIPLRRTEASVKGLKLLEDYKYHVVAEVAFTSVDMCVLDFGVLAYSLEPSYRDAGYAIGEFLEGDLTLSIDPYFYFEQLAKRPEVPPLIYEWNIGSIHQDTTPLVLLEGSGQIGSGRPIWRTDEARRSYERVTATTMNLMENHADQPPHASPAYVLHCVKNDVPPRKFIGN